MKTHLSLNLLCILVLLLCLLQATPIHLSQTQKTIRDDIAEWTVLMYFDGDQTESTYSLSEKMRTELTLLQEVGSTDKVHFVVLLDLDKNNDSALYYIQPNNRISYPLSVINVSWSDECNMGKQETLTEFLIWSATMFPAHHYNVYLNNHGGGWYGICADDIPTYDILTLPELSAACSTMSSHIGKSIDVLSMDACLMSSVEVAYELKDTVQYMISSEAVIHTHETPTGLFLNWDIFAIYQNLTKTPSLTPVELCEISVETFQTDTTYLLPPSLVKPQSVDCINTINISKIDTVVTEVNSLSQLLLDKIFTMKFRIPFIFQKTQRFSGGYDFFGYSYYPFIDLYDFCKHLKQWSWNRDIKNQAQQIMDLVESCVLFNHHGKWKIVGEHPDAHGLSIYFPYRKNLYMDRYQETSFAQDTFWDEWFTNRFL